MSVGSTVSFFLGDCCSVEGDCADMDARFFFTAFGKMRTPDSLGSSFHLSYVMAHALAQEDLFGKRCNPLSLIWSAQPFLKIMSSNL